mgnify:CR=1 FL=1
MTVNDIYFTVQDRINKHNTGSNQNISERQFVGAFNMALYFWFDQRVKVEEGNKILATELQSFIVNLKQVPSYNEDYYFILLPEDYYYYKRVKVRATKESCGEQDLTVRIVEESNIDTYLQSDLDKPSFKWQDTVGSIASNEVHVYHGDDFKVTNINLVYYKKPTEIAMEAVSGVNTTTTLEGSSLYEVINFTALILASDIKDGASIQTLRNLLNQ